MKIKEGNVLTKITNYRLQRTELGNVFVEIHEILNETAGKKFFATPIKPPLGMHGLEKFDIYGDSETEVLENLINQIMDLKNEEIFPQKGTVR